MVDTVEEAVECAYNIVRQNNEEEAQATKNAEPAVLSSEKRDVAPVSVRLKSSSEKGSNEEGELDPFSVVAEITN